MAKQEYEIRDAVIMGQWRRFSHMTLRLATIPAS